MRFPRSSGIVLHISSLPSDYGIGDFGPSAFEFVDTLERAGQTAWQILPLGPTGYGSSPYQSLSAFAGNPIFVSLEVLLERRWLRPQELSDVPAFPKSEVDYDAVEPWRRRLLATAFERFVESADRETQAEWREFCVQHAWWLEDYALFVALKEHLEGVQWTRWPDELVRREPSAIEQAKSRLRRRFELETFVQFQFFEQWNALKQYAHQRGIRIIGDVPIFVAHDSADVWSHQEMFNLDETGEPNVVAGVPPDYFSETGQLWGNPLYRWDVLARRGYDWWVQRFRHAFELFDQVRLDHFRGFEAYWEIPGKALTAVDGRWVPGPGRALFEAVTEKLGKLALIAEDLGVITPPVEALRDELELPGMRVLQFAFGNDSKASDYQPHNFPRHSIAYTGTHDNDTAVGWFTSEPGEGTTRTAEEIDREHSMALAYTGTTGDDIAWDLLRLAWGSVADTAIAPMQDVLSLGSWARMNLPGTTEGNWRWRLDPTLLTPAVEKRLRALTAIYERIPNRAPDLRKE